MRKAKICMMFLVIGFLLVVSPVFSQGTDQSSQPPRGTPPENQKVTVGKATDFIGSTVVDPKGQTLGRIQDAVIDLQNLQPSYLIVSSGGFWGVGRKLTALPVSAFQRTKDKTFVANIDKETFDSAPAFNRNDWPPGTGLSWSRDIHSFHGLQPWQQTSSLE